MVAQQGADSAATLGEVSELAALPGWWGLPAVKAGLVFVADAALFLRPGPRLVSIALLLQWSRSVVLTAKRCMCAELVRPDLAACTSWQVPAPC